MTKAATVQLPESLRIRERCVVDRDDFDWWLGQKGWSWQGIDRGDYQLTLEQAQLLYVTEDPVLWCRAFLDDPSTGKPYEYWGYQRSSIRSWYQDVIHQDGAEVGKTREIVGLILWGMCTAMAGTVLRPSMLVAAPQQTHLDEIIMAMEEHLGAQQDASGRKPLIHRFWREPKRTPHYLAKFVTPRGAGRVYFRPAGHDGEAFRGVHVNALALFDEAAKAKRNVIWSEFFRAMLPGCRRRIYSVPDGDNTTRYYAMTQEAKLRLEPEEQGLRLIRWSKALMPPPFWTSERQRHFVQLYNGADSPGYQRNVLGNHGQQENPVWPWETLEPNVLDVPEYRALKLFENAQERSLHVEAYRIELGMVEGKKTQNVVHLDDRYLESDDFHTRKRDELRDAVRRLLRGVFQNLGSGVYWGGADLGFAKDPTEIMLWREVGSEMRRVVRISARGVTYDVQCELIFCLDELFGFNANWGVDFGSAGTSVVQDLQNREEYADGRYDERLTGFYFATAVDALAEDGSVLEEEDPKTGEPKPVRIPAKELATNLITTRFQRLGVAMPYDPDVVADYMNHTAREGAKHRIFSKQNDHSIDADRVAWLRKAFNEQIAVADVFAAGVHQRPAA